MKILEQQIDNINKLCDEHRVKALFAFGSITKNKLSSDSDIDFVIEIDSSDPFIYAENYFAFKFRLEKLLKRKIDLLEQKAIKNPFLREEIEKSKIRIYGN